MDATTTDARKARHLIRNILADADWLIPELARLLVIENQLVPGDDADENRLFTFLDRMTGMLTDVIDLRALSHKHTEDPRG